MGWTVSVLRALVDLWCFNLYHSELVVGVMGFLYFDLQLDPLLGSPVVFRLSHIRYPAPTTLRKCTMN